MPMQLEGSCRCGAVAFSVASHTPCPYQLCYCSICRKTAGGGGYAINLGALAATLEVRGRAATATFHATIDGQRSAAERHLCRRCGTALWLFDPRWPELLHPFASAIDTPLPRPPSRVHILLADAPAWVRPRIGRNDRRFDGYPEQSIAEWHRSHGMWVA